MKTLHISMIMLLVMMTSSIVVLQQYANADNSSAWYRYTVIGNYYNGTGGSYTHEQIQSINQGTSVSVKSEPVSGKPVPWSDTLPPDLLYNYTEYCSMGSAIRQYFQNQGMIPIQIRFSQVSDGGPAFQTDFFVILSSQNDTTMMNLGFTTVGSNYEHESMPLLDCKNKMSYGDMPFLNVQGINYSIPYSINYGKVINTTADVGSKSITILVNATKTGSITVMIPRTLLDAKVGNSEHNADLPFVVTQYGTPVDFQEYPNNVNRMVIIPWSGSGTQSLKITGTVMVPEFPLVVPILLIGIVSAIAFYRMRFRK